MVQDNALAKQAEVRYAGWRGGLGEKILSGKTGLAELADLALDKGIDPKARSGRQEALENLVNRYL